MERLTLPRISGGETSTVKEQVELFPCMSSAVYDTSVDPTLKKSPGACVAEVLCISQLSVAAGSVQLTWAPHCPSSASSSIPEGHSEKTGASVSWTITLKEQVAEFPAASVAVQVTSVVPKG